MSLAILGGESVAAGQMTRHALRTRYTAIYPNIYVPRDAELTAAARAEAASLWSRRRGVVAGRSAAALHGSKWVDPGAPAELLYDNRHCPRALQTYGDQIADDERMLIRGMSVTTPARTALDLACRSPLDRAVAAGRCARERYGIEDVRRRVADTAIRRTSRHQASAGRPRPHRLGLGVTARDVVATVVGPGRSTQADYSDPGARRVRPDHRPTRHGLGGRQDRRRV